MTTTAFLAMAATFNLVCTGTHVQTKNNSVVPDTQFTHAFRVDLDSGRYCRASCEQTLPIFQVTDTQIVFTRLERDAILIEVRVSRESGFYSAISNSPSGTGWSQGTCTKEPFTGFPARKF
ncbi:hypothetical protein [Sphingopyxis granuli]|uniref:hypothetical protein n=1 Tax=Sphingopyxis granuli TaxID=267128 RepID=UPI001BAE9CD3|nr:hypothetical protein [Sphingopyxis granuli]QUM74595.1 hypothetical protein ICN83_20710 [Sphingopyxis granuli]